MECDNVRALRRSNRLQLILPARCRSRSGFADEVVISDLSEHGCRIDSLGLILHVGDLVVVRPAGIEGLTGVIRWIKGHSAGIEFDRPLYPPVVEHLHRRHERFLTPEYLANLPGKLRLAA
ncbi:PilZ domain-containing protein [Novosphingobium sp.]|uniref:PilZ domain-containing protein n=1 Tax=Novosphingobium sp. TaxID=1874826 RepID=UPI0035AF0BF5